MISKLMKTGVCCLLALAPFGASHADDSGFYLGGSLGQAGIEVDFAGVPGVPAFDENDTAYKIFAGYNFTLLPVINLGVEGGYVDFGGPKIDIVEPDFGIDASVGVDGPLGVFGKLGYIFWDAEASLTDRNNPANNLSDDDSGSDLAYGVGARLNLGSLEVRGEYEYFDIEDAESVGMWSIGLAYYFN